MRGEELWKLTYKDECDVDGDGLCTANDINVLVRQIRNGTAKLASDLQIRVQRTKVLATPISMASLTAPFVANRVQYQDVESKKRGRHSSHD